MELSFEVVSGVDCGMAVLKGSPRAPRWRGESLGGGAVSTGFNAVFLTRARVALVDRFWRPIRLMTSFHAMMCFLGVSVDISLHLRGWIPQNRIFCGANRHFQAGHTKFSNFYIIKTTAWIPTKFCTPIKTTKYVSWVVRKRGKEIQDGGWSPSWKNIKIAISLQPFNRFWTLRA